MFGPSAERRAEQNKLATADGRSKRASEQNREPLYSLRRTSVMMAHSPFVLCWSSSDSSVEALHNEHNCHKTALKFGHRHGARRKKIAPTFGCRFLPHFLSVGIRNTTQTLHKPAFALRSCSGLVRSFPASNCNSLSSNGITIISFYKKRQSNMSTTGVANTNDDATQAVFRLVSKYTKHLRCYQVLASRGSVAPVSAYETADGAITGRLFLSDKSYDVSVPDVLVRMTKHYEQRLENKEIESYTIMYHSTAGRRPAIAFDSMKAISVQYRSASLDGAVDLAFDRIQANDSVRVVFRPIAEFEEQGVTLPNVELTGQDLAGAFPERISLRPKEIVSEAGIKLTVSNTARMGGAWQGIFGSVGGMNFLVPWLKDIAEGEGRKLESGHTLHEKEFADIAIKVLVRQQEPKVMLTACPVVKTERSIPTVTTAIDEWEHVEGKEAVVTCGGRGTFLLKYYATDYAERRAIYQEKKNTCVRLSAIASTVQL